MNDGTLDTKTLLNRTSVGFWLYLMTDCLLFGSLFSIYVVLRDSIAGGPAGSDIFEMPTVLVETIALLLSSFACGIALMAMIKKNVPLMVVGLIVTGLLGVVFLSIELDEFTALVQAGTGPDRSAFLSAFFTLVGTHGLHIFTGLVWLVVLLCSLAARGLTSKLVRQITLFGLFWHFLDVIWIFIFTLVYLMGVMV